MKINSMGVKTGKQIIKIFRNHSNLLGLGQNFFKHVLVVELVSKELNHFGVIADLFRQIGGHSSRFVLSRSF